MKAPIVVCVFLAAVVVLFFGLRSAPEPNGETKLITPSGSEISLITADTEGERNLGLGGRASMRESEGMLFVFPDSGIYGFWMKGMEFPLDIIWLDGEGTVIYLKEQVATSTYPELFTPQEKAKYVLEVNAGAAERTGIESGTVLVLE